MKPQVEQVESLLASGKNFWRDYLAKWKFAETKPYVAVAHANPQLIAQEQAERTARAEAQTNELKKNTTRRRPGSDQTLQSRIRRDHR